MLGKGPDFLAVRRLVARSSSREPVTVSPPSAASTLRNPFIVGYASLTLLTYSLVASSGTAAYLASLLNLDGQKKGPGGFPGPSRIRSHDYIALRLLPSRLACLCCENRDSYIAFHLLSDGPLAYSISLLTRKGRVLNTQVAAYRAGGKRQIKQ